jgi:hypothetical protein
MSKSKGIVVGDQHLSPGNKTIVGPDFMTVSRKLIRCNDHGGWNIDGVIAKYALKAGQFGMYFSAMLFRCELLELDVAIDDIGGLRTPELALYFEKPRRS